MGLERTCGTCSLCCKLVAVEPLNKKGGEWCPHVQLGKGCSIYPTRPTDCAVFKCGWLDEEKTPDHWRPMKSKMVIHQDSKSNTLFVEVDENYKARWKEEPYYSDLKRWSKITKTGAGRILLRVGNTTWIIFPEEDLFIGETQLTDTVGSGYETNGLQIRPAAVVLRGASQTRYVGSTYMR